MVSRALYLCNFLYLMDHGLAPNVVNKKFNNWLMSIVLNATIYAHWPHFKRFKRSDIFKRLLTCGASLELSREGLAFPLICDDDEIEIDDVISIWDTLMLFFCFSYKKVQCNFL